MGSYKYDLNNALEHVGFTKTNPINVAEINKVANNNAAVDNNSLYKNEDITQSSNNITNQNNVNNSGQPIVNKTTEEDLFDTQILDI